ncbi:legumain-like [Xenia sp. Carnegie-2017]|uniref:legumain-like n=1 Tax=Xenia sp. Carnegie-2017 TaxID=2897299 RepID=UPI001F038C53|nr:legumain-like [Xenia sp. Carnegie-2017]
MKANYIGFTLLFICSVFLLDDVEGKSWVLIVAGSNTWENYRHQADVCHAYQIVHRNKIPDENIVVMMYDDIAHNKDNPTPGKIINKPHGPDVYEGVVKDYTGADVTPKNFLNVLKGEKAAMSGIGSGKVIDSGPDDDVFVYFADHGAPGLLAFPDVAPPLTKKELLHALNFMHEKKKYNKMVLYVEACESGSMFAKKLPDDVKIFTTTAANPHESSYATYWDEYRETYLGDLYSISWMENSDKFNLSKETLQEQFYKVKKRTNLSHVQEYGDESISSNPVIDYQGEGKGSWKPAKDTKEYSTEDSTPSPEVPFVILERRLLKATSQKEKIKIEEKIMSLLQERQKVRETVQRIVERAIQDKGQRLRILEGRSGEVTQLNCHSDVVHAYSEKCFPLGKNDAALRSVHVLANMCEERIPSAKLLSAIEEVCLKNN